MSTISSVSKDISFVDPSDMDTSSSTASSPTLSAGALPDAIEEHLLYCFHDGSFVFKLEGVKYNVHSSLLARHCGFASTWAQDLRKPEAAGISRSDIDSFLSMIYLATYEYPGLSLSAGKWTSILHLATKWKAHGIRSLAIKNLTSNLTSLDKLFLCRKYDVPEWLASACAALALRPDPLSMVEAEQLEKADIVRIFLAREAVSKGGLVATGEAVISWIAGLLPQSEPATSSHVAATPAPSPAPSIKPISVTGPAPAEPAAITTTATPVQTAPGQKLDQQDPLNITPSAHPAISFFVHKREASPTPKEAPAAHSPSAPLEEVEETSHSREASPATNTDTSLFRTQPSTTSTSTAQEAGPSGLNATHVLPAQAVAPPIVPVRTPEVKTADAVDAIRAERYDEALNFLTMANVKIVASHVAPTLIEVDNTRNPSVGNIRRLRALLRAVMRRAVSSPGFIPCGAQFVAALQSAETSIKGVKLEVALDIDMQSLSAAWAVFRAGGKPSVDRGGIMADLSTSTRTVYQAQMGHGRGFFRTLVRLGALPATNKYVEMLVKAYPLVVNP